MDSMTDIPLPSILSNCITGIAGSSFAVISTMQEQIEWGIRTTGALLGLLVAAVSLYRLLRRRK